MPRPKLDSATRVFRALKDLSPQEREKVLFAIEALYPRVEKDVTMNPPSPGRRNKSKAAATEKPDAAS